MPPPIPEEAKKQRYVYQVKISCLKFDPNDERDYEGTHFWQEFSVIATDEAEAIYKAKEKAKKEGYCVNYHFDGPDPKVRKL